MSLTIFFLVLIGVALVVAVVLWTAMRRYAIGSGTEVSVQVREIENVEVTGVESPEILGERDGSANLPNDLTHIPFPTPAMEQIYEEGERRRAEMTSQYVLATKILHVREQVLVQRSEQLGKRIAGASIDADCAKATRDLSLVEQSLAAKTAALESAEKDHQARLEAVDAETLAQVDRYWGANLRARDRSGPDLPELDALILSEPSAWRVRRDVRGF